MRKFLQVMGIAALVLLVAAPAMAIDFKFSGSYRVRMFAADGIGSETTSVTSSPFAERVTNQRNQNDIRFRPYFIVSDDNGNIQSHLRFEIGDVTFGDSSEGTVGRNSGGTPPNDGVNVETKWAFIDFQLPFGIPARLRAGAQGFYLPKGMILDDDSMGIRIYGKSGIVGYEGFWYQIDEREQSGTVTGTAVGALPSGPSSDDIDIYGMKIDLNFDPAFNMNLYGVYRQGSIVTSPVAAGTSNDTASSTGYWIGGGFNGKVGIFTYDIDGVYGYDEPYLRTPVVGTQFQTREGWMFDGGVEFPVGPVAIGLRFTVASGDDADTKDKNEDMPAIMYATGVPTSNMASYTPKGAQIFWNSNGSTYWRGGYATQAGNNYAFGGYFKYYPVKALMTQLTGYYIGAMKANSNFYTGKSQVGFEWNLLAEYTMYTGFKVWGLAGMILTPSQGQPSSGSAVDLKNVTLVSIGVQHDF